MLAVSTKIGPARAWTDNRNESFCGDPLSRFDCIGKGCTQEIGMLKMCQNSRDLVVRSWILKDNHSYSSHTRFSRVSRVKCLRERTICSVLIALFLWPEFLKCFKGLGLGASYTTDFVNYYRFVLSTRGKFSRWPAALSKIGCSAELPPDKQLTVNKQLTSSNILNS